MRKFPSRKKLSENVSPVKYNEKDLAVLVVLNGRDIFGELFSGRKFPHFTTQGISLRKKALRKDVDFHKESR